MVVKPFRDLKGVARQSVANIRLRRALCATIRGTGGDLKASVGRQARGGNCAALAAGFKATKHA